MLNIWYLTWILNCHKSSQNFWDGVLVAALSKRQSGPRCLLCGNDRTEPITFDSRDGLTYDFKHSCGGMLQLLPKESDPKPIRFHFRPRKYILNIDGYILKKE